MKTVTYFNKPDTSAKKVFLFFHGNFPKNCIMHKDATLPCRLFPNAEFIIRCNTNNIETIRYFEQRYYGRKISFTTDKIVKIPSDVDAIYSHYILMCAMRPSLSKPVVDFQKMLYTSTVKTYIFFNDENIEPLKFMTDYVRYQKTKNNINVPSKNVYLSRMFMDVDRFRTDFKNVHLLVNENKITDWGELCYKEYMQEHDFNICYLSDSILYDFPDKNIILNYVDRPRNTKFGVFIAFFLKERVELLNKLFNYNTPLWITFIGKHSEKLLPRWENVMTGEIVENSRVPFILEAHSWTIYIGKACKSKYLGATFYEPLFRGIPVFVWSGTDPEHKIFPGMDCYFDDERDLYQLVNRTSLSELCKQQIDKIYESSSI